MVDIGQEAHDKLKAVCSGVLPIVPRKRSVDHLDDFGVTADLETKRVEIQMSWETAQCFHELLDKALREYAFNPIELTDETLGLLESWAKAFDKAVQAVIAYHDTNEPGVGP